jgi:iron-sulfur cluster repair protein YtfE (RIC family)
MLTPLGRRQPGQGDAVALLLACHERIRRFCALGQRVAQGGPDAQIQEAAAQLVRYFAVALPLHIADEEHSVRPRLAAGGDALAAALDTMSREHVEIDALLGELLRRWREIERLPEPTACSATADGARLLTAHMEQHLAGEETIVFPALQLLPPTQLVALADEMRERRR